jgi:phosphate transport system permease protein
MSSTQPDPAGRLMLAERPARERARIITDRVFAAVMGVGGGAVIIAILLIFLYLLYIVAPLFSPATIASTGLTKRLEQSATAHIALDEYAEIGLDVSANGAYRFFSAGDGHTLVAGLLPGTGQLANGTLSIAASEPNSRALFVAAGHGQIFVARADYAISYPDDTRLVTPSISLPLGDAALAANSEGSNIRLLSGQSSDEETTIVAVAEDGGVSLLNVVPQSSFLDDEITFETTRTALEMHGDDISHVAIDVDQRELYVVSANGVLSLYNIMDKSDVELVGQVSVVEPGRRVTALEFLSGGISVLIGDDQGGLAQWFPQRDANNLYSIVRARSFPPLPAAVVKIAPEHFRKAFAAIDETGNLGLYHTTAERQVLLQATNQKDPVALAISPRADAVIVIGASGDIETFSLDNKHPEISWNALWGEVWYESREQPQYIWQSSSASAVFEPKFSLTPLTFGTLKATFYSMIFAVPLAVLGAIYTAYFMAPALRTIVKPSIEVMAALPTVILGFLAGLWLAPLIERELLGLIIATVIVPGAIIGAAWLWLRLPDRWRGVVPGGWEALFLIPIICLAGWASLSFGSVLEVWFFGGSLPHWLTTTWGITYDQRNSLVVGIAIGFAVIPTIFTISEDAVYSVPRSLTMGSLALGATPWQTALRVVLLTASPGIFSAIMIGMGRAVGETMIVLMATGNTPIMDLNIFQGFRALSANIAVEMPESEVHSTHYRILFLAALVLFLVTFVVNTVAEVVRQRLRRKYASL